MNVTWKVEGAENWTRFLKEDITCSPIEIATKIIEKDFSNCPLAQDITKYGLIFLVTHDKMKSIDETFICYVPTVLANAGLYKLSSKLQSLIDKIY